MRLWVRARVQINTRSWLFKDSWRHTGHLRRQSALPTTNLQAICFQGSMWQERKDNAFQSFHLQCHSCLCYHHISTPWLENINPIPVQSTKQSTHEQNKLTLKVRLTHVQILFTWNQSPLQFSKLSIEYSLLPPRSAIGWLLAHTSHSSLFTAPFNFKSLNLHMR